MFSSEYFSIKFWRLFLKYLFSKFLKILASLPPSPSPEHIPRPLTHNLRNADLNHSSHAMYSQENSAKCRRHCTKHSRVKLFPLALDKMCVLNLNLRNLTVCMLQVWLIANKLLPLTRQSHLWWACPDSPACKKLSILFKLYCLWLQVI